MKTITVAELHALLTEALREGKGGRPVYIQDVVNGLTFAVPAGAGEGNPADGELFWVWPAELEPC